MTGWKTLLQPYHAVFKLTALRGTFNICKNFGKQIFKFAPSKNPIKVYNSMFLDACEKM